jgi:hypothetical protein
MEAFSTPSSRPAVLGPTSAASARFFARRAKRTRR